MEVSPEPAVVAPVEPEVADPAAQDSIDAWIHAEGITDAQSQSRALLSGLTMRAKVYRSLPKRVRAEFRHTRPMI